MTCSALRAHLDSLSIRLSARGDRLVVDGPDDVLDDSLVEQIREHKDELLESLQNPRTLSAKEPDLSRAALGHRFALACWPVEWRQKWGERANALQDQGLDWRAAELKAFNETHEEIRQAEARGEVL